MIRFEMSDGARKVRGLRIHGSRYGLPKAPDEDYEITFVNDALNETLHAFWCPYPGTGRLQSELAAGMLRWSLLGAGSVDAACIVFKR